MSDNLYAKFKIGNPVKLSLPKQIDFSDWETLHYKTKKPILGGLLGHVTGFVLVEYDHGYSTNINVQWADGRTFDISPNNLKVL